jgi:mannitol/fructose-specific phosphotransferase system IIA component (Ntr-type)
VKPVAAIVTLRRGLDLESPDDVPVRVFVVHVHRGGSTHGRVLAEMARLANADVVSTLCAARDPARVITELLGRTAA